MNLKPKYIACSIEDFYASFFTLYVHHHLLSMQVGATVISSYSSLPDCRQRGRGCRCIPHLLSVQGRPYKANQYGVLGSV